MSVTVKQFLEMSDNERDNVLTKMEPEEIARLKKSFDLYEENMVARAEFEAMGNSR